MKYRLLLMLAFAPFVCHADEADKGYLTEFVQGNYQLKGKVVDSKKPYSGNVDIKLEQGVLLVSRTVDGQKISSEAAIEPFADDIKTLVLRFAYHQNAKQYVQTCTIATTLDEHAALDCYIHLEGDETKLYAVEGLIYR